MSKKRTRRSECDGLTHVVDARPKGGRVYDTWTWCENAPFLWVDPAFTKEPATCLRCLTAQSPGKLPNMEGT